jgi:hypothetical protein
LKAKGKLKGIKSKKVDGREKKKLVSESQSFLREFQLEGWFFPWPPLGRPGR